MYFVITTAQTVQTNRQTNTPPVTFISVLCSFVIMKHSADVKMRVSEVTPC